MSNIEKLLNALKTGEDVSGFIPQSRQEEILKRICLKESLDDLTPLSRVECLLIEAAENMSGGGDIPEGGNSIARPRFLGTPIPPNEFVEKLYFNTDMTIDEVVKHVKSFIPEGRNSIDLLILSHESDISAIYYEIAHATNGVWGCDISSELTYITEYYENWETGDYKWKCIFTSRKFTDEDDEAFGFDARPTFVGWNPELVNPIEVNVKNELNSLFDMSSIVSITPFIDTTRLTPVPKNEFVEKIYFNTNMSIDEVINYAKSFVDPNENSPSFFGFTFFENMENQQNEYDIIRLVHTSCQTASSSELTCIIVMKYRKDSIYFTKCIFTSREFKDEDEFDWSVDARPTFVGWDPELVNPIEVNAVNKPNDNSEWGVFMPDMILLASITPFNYK